MGATKKKIPHIQEQRRRPNKTVGRVELRLESNPIPARHIWRAQTKLCAHQDPGTPQRQPDLPLIVGVSLVEAWSAVACRGDRGTGSNRPGRHVLA